MSSTAVKITSLTPKAKYYNTILQNICKYIFILSIPIVIVNKYLLKHPNVGLYPFSMI